MFSRERSLLSTLLLLSAFILSVWYIWGAIGGQTNAHDVVEPQSISSKTWLAEDPTTNNCTGTPCLVVEHSSMSGDRAEIVAKLMEYDASSTWDEMLRTTIVFNRLDDLTSLTARHTPTPATMSASEQTELEATLALNGVDIAAMRQEQVLYSADGAFPFTITKVDLPYGAFSQYIYDGFFKSVQAWGLEPDEEQLLTYANIVTNEVEERFSISQIPKDAKIAMILSGPTQPFTYLVAVLALIMVFLEISSPSIRPYTDGVSDLIPFTGFFGTLIGVSGGLEVLGLSNVTDDISKAMSLGRIGSSLGFAINTTILAIVVFGLVILLQYAVRTAVGQRVQVPISTEAANP